jgi:hypothetical protein
MADYPNRSDLRNPATRKVAFTGQTYGDAAQQAAAQGQVAPGSAPTTVEAQQMAAQQAPRPRPGAQQFLRPTERPNEPITAGADFGAGPTAQQAGIVSRIIPEDNTLETLRALYSRYPSPELARLLHNMRIRTPQ